jgi:hypothetical protein
MFNLEEEIKKLKAEMERLKFEYNQFFAGNRKLPPYKERSDFEKKLKELSKRKFFTHGPKYMIETLIASYNSYASLWEKIMREIEEGRYVRGKGWVGKDEMMKDSVPVSVKEPVKEEKKEDEHLSRVYEEYCELKNTLEGRVTIDREKFVRQLKETEKKLKMEKGCKKVEFRVVVEDGKAKIKVIPVKE